MPVGILQKDKHLLKLLFSHSAMAQIKTFFIEKNLLNEKEAGLY